MLEKKKEKYIFNSLQDVLVAIEKSGYNRNFASIVGFEYAFEEDRNFKFNEGLNKYSFFFYFLDAEQDKLTDDEFRKVILELIKLEDKDDMKEIKRVIYHKQIKIIEDKFDKRIITKDVYKRLINKYLN